MYIQTNKYATHFCQEKTKLPFIAINERLGHPYPDPCIVYHHSLVSIAKVTNILFLYLHIYDVWQASDHWK